MIWFSSDHHFSHSNIIKYDQRPFTSIEHMNAEMIARWNAVVGSEDCVFYLGDFSLSRAALSEVLPKLSGKKHLIAGNHDHCHPAAAKTKAKIDRMTQLYLDSGFTTVALSGEVSIADSRTDIPMLLDVVRIYQDALESIAAENKPIERVIGGPEGMPYWREQEVMSRSFAGEALAEAEKRAGG